jgi:hypothetical protein
MGHANTTMKSLKFILCAALFPICSLPAAVLTQSANFSRNELFNTPGNPPVMPADFLSTTFQPFNASLGTLESFTIAWTLQVEWDYVVGVGGNSSISGGVTASLGGISYNGTGGGNGYSFPGSGTLQINPSMSSTYIVSEISGGTAASLLGIVTGADPFTARYASSINASLIGDASVDVRVASTAALTYTYAAAIPEPASFGLLAGLGIAGYLAGVRRPLRRSAA